MYSTKQTAAGPNPEWMILLWAGSLKRIKNIEANNATTVAQMPNELFNEPVLYSESKINSTGVVGFPNKWLFWAGSF